jgi:hypothetical protein
VETWRTAAVELEAIGRRELRSLDTQESIRQIFGEENEVFPSPGPETWWNSRLGSRGCAPESVHDAFARA